MHSSVDAVLAVAGAVPGVARVEQDAGPGGTPALRVHLQSGADLTQIALAISHLLATAGAPPDAGFPSSRPPVQHAPPAARSGSRPRIVRADVHLEGSAFWAEVELGCATRRSRGSARSAVTTSGTRRAVAAATLQALAGLLTAPVHLELEHVEVNEGGSQPLVLVHLSLVCEQGVQQLTGSALVREDESMAIVRAVLDALNRRVELLVPLSG